MSPSSLQVFLHSTEALRSNPRNVRKHPPSQIRALAEAITRFGFLAPILIDENNQILAGHARLDAARRLKLPEVPTVRVDHLSERDKRAFVLADNRIAELAGWEDPRLAQELREILLLSDDIEIAVPGFSTAEVEIIIDGNGVEASASAEPETVNLPDDTAVAVSRPGDLWLLGDHRLLCGNALSADDWVTLMQGERAELTVTDPPYNVPIAGHVSGKGAVRHREFPMASGEMTDAAFSTFLTTAFGHIAMASQPGAIAFVFMDWRHMSHILAAGNATFHELKNLVIWHKTNAGMGSFYRSAHELVFAFKATPGPHINNFGLGETGRHRTNVWSHPGTNTFRNGRREELAMHPTVKPVALVMDAIRDCSRRRGIVLDPFAGSGTILLAAERTGRRARAMELDPLYIDTAIRRWQEHTGRDAVLAGGLAFEDLAYLRRSDDGEAKEQTNLQGAA